MDTVLQSILDAGVVGCGGAGFPTHIKLDCKPQYFIINGAECEPLLRTDRHIMYCYADGIVSAIVRLQSVMGMPKTIIALKDTYTQEIGSLKAAIQQANADISLCCISGFYPVGDEQALVYEAAGRVVPAGGIPADVGCVVSNAATMLTVSYALEGKPFVRKTLTVTGAVASPAVMDVPLGISLGECIAAAGGPTIKDYIVVEGGALMGKYYIPQEAQNLPVQKTTSGILVLPRSAQQNILLPQQLKNRAATSCIQCTYCTELCPRYLLGHPIEPHKIMRKLAYAKDFMSLVDDEACRMAALCCECGVCEIYACPMGLQPRLVNATIKRELAARGVRYPKGEGMQGVSVHREQRKTPSQRIAARAGIIDYYDTCGIQACKQIDTDRVALPLKQHIGAASLPVIKSGDRVSENQLIAVCPQGVMGANLHASISGRAEVQADKIVIIGD